MVAPILSGSLLCGHGTELVSTALRDRVELSFCELEVENQGDTIDLGALLLNECRRIVAASNERLALDMVLCWSDQGSYAWGLPVAQELREVLLRIDGTKAVRSLLTGFGEQRARALDELTALVSLGALRVSTAGERTLAMHGHDDDLPLEALFTALSENLGRCEQCPGDPHGFAPCAHGLSCVASRATEPANKQIQLLEEGRRLLSEERWLEADRALSAARDLRVDNPQVLAALALARALNPTREPLVREREAMQFATLASQLDSFDPEVLRLRRQVQRTIGVGDLGPLPPVSNSGMRRTSQK